MVTHYPHPIARFDREAETHRAVDGDNPSGVLSWIRRIWCGLHGHDSLLQFGQDRLFLKCVSCGHESPGWELSETPPVREGARRPAMVRPQLVGARRIA